MTVEELFEWIESARRVASESGQVIEEYEIQAFDVSVVDARIDHGDNTLKLS